MATLRACAICARGFTPAHHTHRMCDEHAPVGRAHRSPTTQAQDATYQRNRRLLLADAPTCVLRIHCDGAPADTADHITPVAHGGSNDMSNLQAACKSCNAAKGAGRPPSVQQWKDGITTKPVPSHGVRGGRLQ
jgi:5-methylcytosine-specific restriction endonuclease McrA